MTLPIYRTLGRIPGGVMLVPLAIGAVVAHVAPEATRIFGSFPGALFTAALPILAVCYGCRGAMIRLDAAPHILREGGVLLGAILFAAANPAYAPAAASATLLVFARVVVTAFTTPLLTAWWARRVAAFKRVDAPT